MAIKIVKNDNSSWLENNSWSWLCICSMAIKMVKNDTLSWLENNSWSWLYMCSTCCKHFPVLSSLTGFVTIVTRRVILVEQKLPTIPENVSSLPIFSGVCVTRSLVLCVCFVDRYLSFCTFSFGHCVVCSSSIYGFWLPLWYLLTLLVLLCFFFWPLCCLFFFDIRIVITPLVSFGHCVVCSSIYRLWLPPFGIFKLFL